MVGMLRARVKKKKLTMVRRGTLQRATWPGRFFCRAFFSGKGADRDGLASFLIPGQSAGELKGDGYGNIMH